MPFTNSFKGKILESIFNNIQINLESTYIGLFHVMPTESTSGTEIIDSSYSRIETNFVVDDVAGTATCTDLIYAKSTVDWGNVVGFGIFGIFDDMTSETLIYYDNFVTVIEMLHGDQYIIDSCSITFV